MRRFPAWRPSTPAARPALTLLTAVAVGLAAGGCTASAPRARGTAPPATFSVATGNTTPTPAMTPIDSHVCSVTVVRHPAAGPLQPEGRWKPDSDAISDEAVTVTRGRDADICPGELPPKPYCDEAVPWTGLGVDALAHASGAQSWTSSTVPGPDARPAGAEPDPSRVPRTLTYTVMRPKPGHELRIGPILLAGAAACARTTSQRVGNATVLRGPMLAQSLEPDSGPPLPRTLLVVIRRDGAGWAQLEGPAWAEHDIDSAEQALRAALDRYCSSCSASGRTSPPS